MKTIYLDVDGVINAVSTKKPTQNTGWDGEWRTEMVNGYPILWSVELVDRLNALAARDDVEIVWLTTWRHDAASVLSPALGIEGTDWHVLDCTDDELRNPYNWWKLARIRQFRKLHARYDISYWLDDDIQFYQPAVNWLREEERDVKYISPTMHHGLTRKHIEQIERDFAN